MYANITWANKYSTKSVFLFISSRYNNLNTCSGHFGYDHEFGQIGISDTVNV